MARLPYPRQDNGTWGDILNDFLRVSHNPDGTIRNAQISKIAEQKSNKNQPEGYAGLNASGKIDKTIIPTITKNDVGLNLVDNTADANKPISAPQQAAIDSKISKLGDTLTGNLTIDGAASARTLQMTSSSSGGLNTNDSTSRIVLESYQKAQLNNDSQNNTTQAHYGEVLRIDMKHRQAKGAIAFRESYLGAPEGARSVAWLVAHGEANDSTPTNPSWHNHFSIEVPDENGQLQTTFEFPFAEFDVPQGFGIPMSRMYNRSTTRLIASNNGLVVENATGVSKNIYFGTGRFGKNEQRRWGLQADATSESGDSTGTNFRINRYNDLGEFVASPLFIRRNDGQVGINTSSPNAQLHVNGHSQLDGNLTLPSTASRLSLGNTVAQGGAAFYIERNINGVGMLFRNTTASGHIAASVVVQSQTTSSRALQTGLITDTINRLSIETSGLIEWGAGGAAGRDTNLYRSGTNTLQTDGNLNVGSSLRHVGSSLGFYGAAAISKPTVSGSTSDNSALESLLSALVNLGLITNTAT